MLIIFIDIMVVASRFKAFNFCLKIERIKAKKNVPEK